jgi:hypothetical protein
MVATNSPLLSAAAALADAPALPCRELANLSTLSLARSIHDADCHERGLVRILAEKRFSFYITAESATCDLARLRNTRTREQSQLADLMTPCLGQPCPECRGTAKPGEMEDYKDGALECSCDGLRYAVECGELVAVVSCETCANLVVKADCLKDEDDDYFCDSCCEGAREAHYQQTGEI